MLIITKSIKNASLEIKNGFFCRPIPLLIITSTPPYDNNFKMSIKSEKIKLSSPINVLPLGVCNSYHQINMVLHPPRFVFVCI